MKYIYKELNYNSSSEPYDEDTDDDGDTNTVLYVLLVIIPIIIILIVILIVCLVRKYKQKEISNMPEKSEKLMRDTINTTNNISSQE